MQERKLNVVVLNYNHRFKRLRQEDHEFKARLD
jgi:hypothetical protein